jgi:hypothetical protein
VRVRSHEHLVTTNLRGDDLSDDVAVGEADDKAVLGRIVLVLGLGGQALAGIVVGLALATALVLDLVPPERCQKSQKEGKETVSLREVRFVLDELGLFPRVSN